MSLASVSAQQAALAAAEAAAAQGAATSGSSAQSTSTGATADNTTGQAALNALSGNFQSFLGMLMTQLQNQDPTSPLDSNQFTQELVAFSGVEQQINTNSSLTRLIQLTQSGQLMQAAAMTGKQVDVTSNRMPLQNGAGSVQFSLNAAEPVAIAVADATGQIVRTATIDGQAGANTWTWNGVSDAGTQVPDGAYQVSVYGAGAAGATAPVPFTVGGTVTGTESTSADGLQLQLGAVQVGFDAVQSMTN